MNGRKISPFYRTSSPIGAAAQKLGFLKFPFSEVRVLLLRNIVAAKPMVRFGCPKHQKVYQGHKKVPCEFRTRPQPTRNLPQLSQPSPNKKIRGCVRLSVGPLVRGSITRFFLAIIIAANKARGWQRLDNS